MKTYFTLLLILLVQFVLADTYPRNESIDIKHYTFKLDVNDSTDIIAGEAIVRLQILKSITEFELDLINQKENKKGMVVSGVYLSGKELKYVHQNNRLKILLPAAPKENDILEVTIRYSGIPSDGLIISKNKFGDRTFFGDNWPDRARNWLPCIDHPYDKAGVDFIVHAPLHYTVVGNGVKQEESYWNKNQKRTHWHEEIDIPTKVMVIGVARFAIEHAGQVVGIPVESWVYPQNRIEGFYDYKPAVEILEFFHKHVGPYPYKKLANVQSTTIYGGMENASNIFYYENSVTGKGTINDLLAHEIAHQWFGNSASENDWHHVWLSEGFATYFTHIYNEFTHGRSILAQRMEKDRNQVIAYCKKSPAPVINSTITNYSEVLSTHVYQRGSWVLHILRNEIGDDAFWRGIREYYLTYQNSNAMTSDLQGIMEKCSGKQLDYFFNQWLNRTEIPILKASWTFDKKAGIITVTVDQLQKGNPFNTMLDIGIQVDQSSEVIIEPARLDQKNQKFYLKSGSKPLKVTLDPNINLLFEDISKN